MEKIRIFRFVMRIIRCIACIFYGSKCPQVELERDEKEDAEDDDDSRYNEMCR